jgi:hypothetical protein
VADLAGLAGLVAAMEVLAAAAMEVEDQVVAEDGVGSVKEAAEAPGWEAVATVAVTRSQLHSPVPEDLGLAAQALVEAG